MFHIDDDTLRDVVDDPAAVAARLAALGRRFDPAGLGERVVLLRVSGRLDEAERLGRVALRAVDGDTPRRITTLIRLAHVLHWQQNFDEADRLFRQAIDLAEVIHDDLLRAFAYQHLGKSLFDQGRYIEAEGRFVQALRLRQNLDAPRDQIISSRQSLSAARRRLAKGVSDAPSTRPRRP